MAIERLSTLYLFGQMIEDTRNFTKDLPSTQTTNTIEREIMYTIKNPRTSVRIAIRRTYDIVSQTRIQLWGGSAPPPATHKIILSNKEKLFYCVVAKFVLLYFINSLPPHEIQ
jgi:hypothetical protein